MCGSRVMDISIIHAAFSHFRLNAAMYVYKFQFKCFCLHRHPHSSHILKFHFSIVTRLSVYSDDIVHCLIFIIWFIDGLTTVIGFSYANSTIGIFEMNCNTYLGCLYDLRATICVGTVEPRNHRILNMNTNTFTSATDVHLNLYIRFRGEMYTCIKGHCLGWYVIWMSFRIWWNQYIFWYRAF